jgi:hypothetical protein
MGAHASVRTRTRTNACGCTQVKSARALACMRGTHQLSRAARDDEVDVPVELQQCPHLVAYIHTQMMIIIIMIIIIIIIMIYVYRYCVHMRAHGGGASPLRAFL